MKSVIFAQFYLFGTNVYIMCYDYVHLDKLSDISAYRNRHIMQNVMLCTKQSHNNMSHILYIMI